MNATPMPARRYASRGGEKLDAALRDLGIEVIGRRVLDAGASAGGFTDRLLAGGAREVVAVDVAYGQLDWRLRNDPRVVVRERTNVRTLAPALVGEPVDLVCADLSFIGLTAVAEALLAVATPDARLLLLVKPQFELPRDRVPRGGVVRDPDAWTEAMRAVADAYRARGCGLVGAVSSRLPGPKGNREFFLLFARGTPDAVPDPIPEAVRTAP